MDFFVDDGRFADIDHVDFFLNKINGFDCIMLGKQYGHGKPDVACTCNGDFNFVKSYLYKS